MDTSTRTLIGMIATITVTSVIVGSMTGNSQGPVLLLPYEWHKLLHILGAIIFVGNIIVTGVWMFLAERTREARVLSFASRVVNWADVFFTAPGVFLVLINGLFLSTLWGGLTRTSWVSAAIILFTLSGVVWVAFLLRDQHRLIVLSGGAVGVAGGLPAEFYRVLHRWYFWGVIATVLPLLSLALMVVKPALW